MKISFLTIFYVLAVVCQSQPQPVPVFNSSQWEGEWVIGYPTNLGNYEYTFCSSINISKPVNVSQYGYFNVTQRAFFAPQTQAFDKWGWWQQTSTIYYNIYTPQHAYLDPEMSLSYYLVTNCADDYLQVTTPSGPGGMDYYYFLYMRNNCTSGACKAAEQNIGCLSNIPTQANFNPQELVGSWYITGIYADSSYWAGAQCGKFEFDVVSSIPPFYGIKIQYTAANQTHQVYATTVVLNTENPGMIFQLEVPPIFVNYFDGSSTGVLISGKEDVTYFITNSPNQMTNAEVQLFKQQIEEANLENCENCKVTTFTGCSQSDFIKVQFTNFHQQ